MGMQKCLQCKADIVVEDQLSRMFSGDSVPGMYRNSPFVPFHLLTRDPDAQANPTPSIPTPVPANLGYLQMDNRQDSHSTLVSLFGDGGGSIFSQGYAATNNQADQFNQSQHDSSYYPYK